MYSQLTSSLYILALSRCTNIQCICIYAYTKEGAIVAKTEQPLFVTMFFFPQTNADCN